VHVSFAVEDAVDCCNEAKYEKERC